jgi:large subunit ribosomal protein L29
MPKTTFHDLDDVSLVTQLRETKDELFKLRFQHATGQLQNHTRLRQARRDIARLETELRAREIDAAEAEAEVGASDEETS